MSVKESLKGKYLKNNIFAKFFILFAAIFLVVLSILGTTLTILVNVYTQNENTRLLKENTQTVAQSVELTLTAQDMNDIYSVEKEMICSSLYIISNYIDSDLFICDVEGNIIPGLEIFPYYTEAIADRKKRCIGNIVLEVNLNGQETKVIGFENHGGQTYDVPTTFGKVLFGNGNKFGDTQEGFFKENVIATYLHGPLLSKNPELTDYIIKHCLDRKYQENITLEPLNDEFENLCRKQLLDRFLT